jgi:predicted Ser/Thr protein kinase
LRKIREGKQHLRIFAAAALVRKGGQGSVFKSVYKGKDVAIKVIPHSKSSTIEAELAAVRVSSNATCQVLIIAAPSQVAVPL